MHLVRSNGVTSPRVEPTVVDDPRIIRGFQLRGLGLGRTDRGFERNCAEADVILPTIAAENRRGFPPAQRWNWWKVFSLRQPLILCGEKLVGVRFLVEIRRYRRPWGPAS